MPYGLFGPTQFGQRQGPPRLSDYLGRDPSSLIQQLGNPVQQAPLSTLDALGGTPGLLALAASALSEDPTISTIAERVAAADQAAIRSQHQIAAANAESRRQALLDQMRAASVAQGSAIQALGEHRQESLFPYQLQNAASLAKTNQISADIAEKTKEAKIAQPELANQYTKVLTDVSKQQLYAKSPEGQREQAKLNQELEQKYGNDKVLYNHFNQDGTITFLIQKPDGSTKVVRQGDPVESPEKILYGNGGPIAVYHTTPEGKIAMSPLPISVQNETQKQVGMSLTDKKKAFDYANDVVNSALLGYVSQLPASDIGDFLDPLSSTVKPEAIITSLITNADKNVSDLGIALSQAAPAAKVAYSRDPSKSPEELLNTYTNAFLKDVKSVRKEYENYVSNQLENTGYFSRGKIMGFHEYYIKSRGGHVYENPNISTSSAEGQAQTPPAPAEAQVKSSAPQQAPQLAPTPAPASTPAPTPAPSQPAQPKTAQNEPAKFKTPLGFDVKNIVAGKLIGKGYTLDQAFKILDTAEMDTSGVITLHLPGGDVIKFKADEVSK